jgi:hypothetical protein
MTRSVVGTLCASLLAVGCGARSGAGAKAATEIVSYLATSGCSTHADESSCNADATDQCAWIVLGAPCPAGTVCPAGVCAPNDSCQGNTDQKSCELVASCAWSDVGVLCPAGQSCASGGFCHAASSGGSCACVSPVYCPTGSICPPMECDCSGGASGGTCTCSCPSCMPGQTCQPCACTCTAGSGGGCVNQGTCACACPECPPGETCPACSCGCVQAGTPSSGGTGGASGPTAICNCPACPNGTSCSPCTCSSSGSATDGGTVPMDPCSTHADQTSCQGDGADQCTWIALGLSCQAGATCPSGVCQQSGGGCICECPACLAGQSCPPCSCSCGSAGSTCIPPLPPAACSTAADCHGALPALCMVCANGGNGCAHFVCDQGQCQVAYCGP